MTYRKTFKEFSKELIVSRNAQSYKSQWITYLLRKKRCKMKTCSTDLDFKRLRQLLFLPFRRQGSCVCIYLPENHKIHCPGCNFRNTLCLPFFHTGIQSGCLLYKDVFVVRKSGRHEPDNCTMWWEGCH